MTSPQELQAEIQEYWDKDIGCMGLDYLDRHPEGKCHHIERFPICEKHEMEWLLTLIEREKKAAVEEAILKAIRTLDTISSADLFLDGLIEYKGYCRAIDDLKHIDEPRAFI